MMGENNVIIAAGLIQRKKNIGFLNTVFCEVFQMENSKIKQLTTYQMNR